MNAKSIKTRKFLLTKNNPFGYEPGSLYDEEYTPLV